MKREITLNFMGSVPKEEKKPSPEEVTVYGTGAGLYGYLNVLAEKMGQPDLEGRPFPIHH